MRAIFMMLLTGAFGMAAQSQWPPPDQPLQDQSVLERQWAGTITSVQPEAGRFRMQSADQEVEVAAGAEFNPGWSIEDLVPGLNVVVNGVVESDGTVRAKSVTVVSQPPEG